MLTPQSAIDNWGKQNSASDEKVEKLTEAVQKLAEVGYELTVFFKHVDETLRELNDIMKTQPLQPEGEIVGDGR